MNIKRITDILSRLIDLTTARTSQLTDYTPGSVIRSIYEAIAIELEQYYVLQEENILWGIQNGVLDAFGFSMREATAAYGQVTLSFYAPTSEDITLPMGTSFYSSNDSYPQMYTLIEPYVVPAGSLTAVVIAYCTQTGTVGNVPAGTLDLMSGVQTTTASVTNADDINTGTDEESVSAVRARLNEFVETRGRGTVKAMDYAARTIPEVTGVYIYEETGKVTVYAHDANGDLSADLITKIENAEENYRPVGIPWSVQPVEKIAEDVSVMVTVTNTNLLSATFTEDLEQYIRSYLNTFAAGDDLIVANLVNKIISFSPIIYDLSISVPLGNVSVDPDQIIRGGDITVLVENEVG